jgi:hypothetical protein
MSDDHQTCPLCGQPNSCAMAEGHSVAACWCSGVTLSRAMLERLPPEHQGVRCICAACARTLAAGIA